MMYQLKRILHGKHTEEHRLNIWGVIAMQQNIRKSLTLMLE